MPTRIDFGKLTEANFDEYEAWELEKLGQPDEERDNIYLVYQCLMLVIQYY